MPAIIVLLLAAHLAVVIWAIKDISKPDREVLGGNKRTWMLVVAFGNVIGLLGYLLVGRSFNDPDQSARK
jgi:hypothetical protein